MNNLESLAKELTIRIPGLTPTLAEKFITQGWLRVQQEKEWSWMQKTGFILFPTSITTGTISVTKGSTSATLSATALASWNADTSLPSIGYRQLRLPGNPARIFGISSLDPDFSTNGILTLDTLYTGTTNALSTYRLYSAYNFVFNQSGEIERSLGRLKYMRSNQISQSYLTSKHKVDKSRLQMIDPGRNNYGLPYCYAYDRSRQITTNDSSYEIQLFEFYPHCTSALDLEVSYVQAPLSLEDYPDTIIPAHIPGELIIQASLMTGFQWAEANKAHIKELQGVNWNFLRAQLSSAGPNDQNTYKANLRQAIKKDNSFINEEIIPIDNHSSSPYNSANFTTTNVFAIRES